MSAKKPNIIFVFSDQQRWDTLGCYGQKLPISPNLDQMAAEGVRFEHAYTCQPVCGPVRAVLQTGKYATQVGCETNNRHLPLNADTLANRMKAAGYKTGYIGKWHLASGPNRFDEGINPYYGIFPVPEAHRGGYEYWLASDVLEYTSHAYDGHMFTGDGKVRHFPLNRYRVDAQTDWAEEYLEQQSADEPFFLFLSYIEPHHQNDHNCYEGPIGSKERWANYEIPGDLAGLPGDWVENYPDYLGCCHSLDKAVGRLRNKLKELELDEDTVIIYTSDHGSHFKTRNGEYKRSCHDACLRVPMIFSGPGFSTGEVNENMASLIDIPRTILSIAGADVPEDWQGINLQDAVGRDVGRDAVFAQISESHTGRTIRTKKWKYAVAMKGVKGRWTEQQHSGYIVYHEKFLYDMDADPHEHNNLVADPGLADVRAELAAILKAEMIQAGEAEPMIMACAPGVMNKRTRIMKVKRSCKTDNTSRNALVSSCALPLFCLLPMSESLAEDTQASRPNIVFLLVDDFGKGGLASMGSDLHETPNIDRLVDTGMRFTEGYAACTVCSPSRAAILTGRYPGRIRLTDWIPGKGDNRQMMSIPAWNKSMNHERVLLPEALKKHGYATAFIGKWHLGPSNGHSPTDHGFDINIGGCEWGRPKGKGGYFHPFDMPNVTSKEGDYLTDRLTDYAVDFVKDNKDKPFLLYMSYYTVHGPLQGRPDLVEKYKQKIASGNYTHTNAEYAAMCESLDMSVGRVLKTLEELEIEKNTIVVFTGDNGADYHEYTGGLKNRKGYSHEGGVREPVVFCWPGTIEPGSVSDVPMTGTDYYPTLLDLAGLPLLENEHLDGVSLKPILQAQGTIPERSLFWHYPHYHRTNPYGAIRKGKWKLIEFFEDGALELYDLDKDLAETTNLAGEQPERAKALLDELKAWRTSVDAQMPTLKTGEESSKPRKGKRK